MIGLRGVTLGLALVPSVLPIPVSEVWMIRIGDQSV